MRGVPGLGKTFEGKGVSRPGSSVSPVAGSVTAATAPPSPYCGCSFSPCNPFCHNGRSVGRQSEAAKAIAEFLDTARGWIDEIPAAQQAQRFGNKSFRVWHDQLNEVGGCLCLHPPELPSSAPVDRSLIRSVGARPPRFVRVLSIRFFARTPLHRPRLASTRAWSRQTSSSRAPTRSWPGTSCRPSATASG